MGNRMSSEFDPLFKLMLSNHEDMVRRVEELQKSVNVTNTQVIQNTTALDGDGNGNAGLKKDVKNIYTTRIEIIDKFNKRCNKFALVISSVVLYLAITDDKFYKFAITLIQKFI